MNPGATNTTHSLEELERLEHHVRASGPPPVGSPAHLFLTAMNDRRKAADAGNVFERDLQHSRAAFFYSVAVSQVNAVGSSVASSAAPVRPVPVSLGEQLARENATAGPAAPPPSHTAIANHAARAPISTTNQEILAQAVASACKSVPGFTLAGIGVTESATAPLVSRAPGLPPLASACSPTSAGHGPVVSGMEGGGPRPLPVSLRDQLAGARTQATEVHPAVGSLTPDEIGILRDVPPAERAKVPPEISNHGYPTSGSAPAATQAPAFVGFVPLAPGASGRSAADPIGPGLPLPPSRLDQLFGGAHTPTVGGSAVAASASTGAPSGTLSGDATFHLTPLAVDTAVRIAAVQAKLKEVEEALKATEEDLRYLARVFGNATTTTAVAGSPLTGPSRMVPPK